MTTEPNHETVEVIRERLAVERALDGSAALSHLASARFRLELLNITDGFQHHNLTPDSAHAALTSLGLRIGLTVASSR